MSKEKKINELRNVLWLNPYVCMGSHNADMLAQYLINEGYRKQEEPFPQAHENGGEWISVNDRLPDKNQAVLAYRGEFRGDMMDTYTHLNNGLWEDAYGYRVSTEHEGITHWMELPEPPKGE